MSESTVERTAQQLSPVLNELADLIDAIDEGAWSSPTPCTELDVAALRDHVVAWLSSFAAGYADPDGRAPCLDTITVSDNGAAQVREAAAMMLTALAAGAAQRPLWLGESAMPGDMSASMILWEYQVHGWDLAKATGQNWQPDVAGLLATLEFAPMMLTDDFQGEGKAFAPAVPVAEDSDPLTRLLGLSGRDPNWRPA